MIERGVVLEAPTYAFKTKSDFLARVKKCRILGGESMGTYINYELRMTNYEWEAMRFRMKETA